MSIPVSGMDSWRGRVDRRNGIIHAQYNVTTYLGKVSAQETRGFVRYFPETHGACNQARTFPCTSAECAMPIKGQHCKCGCAGLPLQLQRGIILLCRYACEKNTQAGASRAVAGSVAGQSMAALLDGAWKQPYHHDHFLFASRPLHACDRYINTTNPSGKAMDGGLNVDEGICARAAQ